LLLAAACGAADDPAGVDAGDDSASPINLPDTPYNYAAQELPAHFLVPAVRALENTPADNPITDEGATLGRVLFYDKQLSANGSIACASCHGMASGFTDTNQFSTSFDGSTGSRNAMSITNARWYQDGRFFWDERAATLEDQVLMPIQNDVEMGLTLDDAIEQVAGQSFYAPLFEAAFGDSEATSDRISKALAQFVRSMVSYRSRYDEGLAAAGGNPTVDFANFTAQENQGKSLFFGPQGGCAGCHVNNPPPQPGRPPGNAAIFYVNVATNNGLDATIQVNDNGIGDVSGQRRDNGKFKSPSLRNVALTAPYMHDGRFATLRQVVEHYNSGVQAHPNLDPRLRGPDGTPRRLNLTSAQMDALVAFMGTLTDEAFCSDVKFSDPFVE